MGEIGSISCLQLIKDIPPIFELNILRFGIGFVISCLYMLFTWQLPRIQRNLAGWVALICLVSYSFNLSLYNEYVKQLPLAAVFGTRQASFLLLVTAASIIILKEKLSWFKIGLIFVTLIGIGLVISSSFISRSDQQILQIMGNFSVPDKTNGSVHIAAIQNISPQMTETPETNVSYTFTALSNSTDNEYKNAPLTDVSNLHGHKYTAQGIIISVTLLFITQLCDTIENMTISGSGLKDVNGVFIVFWFYLVGTILSIVTSLIFEDMFIPEDNMDKIFSVIHCTAASVVTFLFTLASQLLKPNVLAIVFSIHTPLALTTQMFLLQSVTPPVELWVLILGLAIITLSVFTMSISAVCFTNVDNRK